MLAFSSEVPTTPSPYYNRVSSISSLELILKIVQKPLNSEHVQSVIYSVSVEVEYAIKPNVCSALMLLTRH